VPACGDINKGKPAQQSMHLIAYSITIYACDGVWVILYIRTLQHITTNHNIHTV